MLETLLSVEINVLDAITNLRLICGNAQLTSKNICILSVDIREAFDSVSLNLLEGFRQLVAQSHIERRTAVD